MTIPVPNVSVVIPAYHAERFIARAIQSVLDQPGVEPEIIVVVDGAVDRTAGIASDFPKTRVVINEVNRGAPAARNRGLALATAPYVMFLDADDWVEGPLLQGLVEAMALSPSDIAFGPLKKQFEAGQFKVISLHTKHHEVPSTMSNQQLIIRLLKEKFITPCATLWNTNFIRENDAWDESLKQSQDFEIVLRCLIRGARPALTGRGYGVHYVHSGSRRVSVQRSNSYMDSRVRALESVVNEARLCGRLDGALASAFIYRTGVMLRWFVSNADHSTYQRAEKLFKELGGGCLDERLTYRLAYFFLGLRRTELLLYRAAHLKKLFRTWRNAIIATLKINNQI